MAPVKRCPRCGEVMFAKDEQFQAKGTWVTYICRNTDCQDYKRTNGKNPYEEKVFVDDEKNKRW